MASAFSIASAVGKEPKLSETSTNSEVIAAFNWYSYSSDTGDSKKYVIQYIQKSFKGSGALVKKLSLLKDWEFGPAGWVAKQLMNGNKVPADYLTRFEQRLSDLNAKATRLLGEQQKEEQIKPPVDRRRAFTPLAASLIAEIDGMIDDGKTVDLHKWLSERTNSSQVFVELSNYYSSFLYELEVALKVRKDASGDPETAEQLREYYGKVSKKELKIKLNFLNELFKTIDLMKVNKKNTRKPRTKKAKTALQQTKNLKYKHSDDTYKVTSIPASEAVGVLQLWIFNTKTRKLGVYHASDSAPLSIKGTTIQNFNEKTSIQKTLRKPEVTLTDVLSANKVSLRKVMENINAKASFLNGRINKDTILLRSVK